MFCKYKNMFGEVGKDIHSYRLFNLAIVDILATIIVAFIIHLIFPNISFIYILLFLFILGIILHRIFCVRTTIDKLLFL
jgi:hypothetical protein